MIEIHLGDNLDVLRTMRSGRYDVIYIDPPFNTGRTQRRRHLRTVRDAYDYGARSRRKWSPKHDNILWYAKDPDDYTFNLDEADPIPYMAPRLVGATKAARGKTPTDTWWHTIVSPNGREKTGCPTQKPLGVVERIVRVHSNRGDRLLDFFAGSGTLGEAAARNGRHAALVDQSASAVATMRERLAFAKPTLRR